MFFGLDDNLSNIQNEPSAQYEQEDEADREKQN